MKQLVQSARKGTATVVEVPAPSVRPDHVLVQVAASVVSPGTERSVMEFAGKGLLGKAQARPDLVRQVLDKARREGLLSTLGAVRERLDLDSRPSPSLKKALSGRQLRLQVHSE
mgnify:CR=1 FL=1